MFNLLSKIRPKWLVQTSLSQLFAVVLLITLKVAKAVVVFWGRAGFCSFQQHVGGNKPLFPGLFVCIFVFFLFSFHLLSSLNVILLIWLAIFKHKWAVGLFLRFCPPPLLSHLSFATSHGKRLCLERISDFFWGSNRYCSWLQLAGLHWSTHYNFISCHYWQQNPRWCDTYFPPKKKQTTKWQQIVRAHWLFVFSIQFCKFHLCSTETVTKKGEVPEVFSSVRRHALSLPNYV